MCVRPVTVKISSLTFHTERSIEVPCGKCVECLKRRQNDWKLRICHECGFWKHVYFFTLTYKDSMLPCNVCYDDEYGNILYSGRKPECERIAKLYDASVYSTTYKVDIQNFLKRIRADYMYKHDERMQLKYFICSEYGPNPKGTKRPHYHGILMTDVSYNELLPYFNNWHNEFGRMEFKEVGITREDKSSVANYISKYCSKGCFESRLEDIGYERISKAWYVMSKNIGLRWIEQRKTDWLKRAPISVSIDGSWNQQMIEQFIELNPESWEKIEKEIDSIIDNKVIKDGKYVYAMPRYYYERVFCPLKEFEKLEYGKPNLRISTHVWHKSRLETVEEVFYPIRGRQNFALAPVIEPLTFECKVSKVKRYVHESFISAAIAYRLYMLALARDRELREAFGDALLIDKNGCWYSTYNRHKERATSYRESCAFSSLSSFYHSNMWKHREFDFGLDCIDLFTNV